MRKIEFNKTKDTILEILCPECKHDTRHKVLQSVETKENWCQATVIRFPSLFNPYRI
jgi:ribosomal protein L44E